MLYKSQRYNEILEIYDTIKKRLEQNPNAYKHVITLTFAACYKMVSNSKIVEKIHLIKFDILSSFFSVLNFIEHS